MPRVDRRGANRRGFLKDAAALALASCSIPAAALERQRHVAPGNRITLGFIGLGFMDQRHHLSRFVGYPEAQVLAVCDAGSVAPAARSDDRRNGLRRTTAQRCVPGLRGLQRSPRKDKST